MAVPDALIAPSTESSPRPVDGPSAPDGGDPPSEATDPRAPVLRWLLVTLIIILAGAGAMIALTIWGEVGLSEASPVVVSSVEAELIAVTLVVLAVLSVYSARAFAVEVDRQVRVQERESKLLRKSFSEETGRILDRSAEHWRLQSEALERAVVSMEQVVTLERQALEATQRTLEATGALLALERQREVLATEQARLRIQRIRPSVALCGVVNRPGPIAKRIGIRLFNQGEDGRRLVVPLRYGAGPAEVGTRPISSISAFSNAEADFGDIDEWSDDLNFQVSVEVDDADGNRYRCLATLRYARNRGMLGSDPKFNPDDWQYPPMSRV